MPNKTVLLFGLGAGLVLVVGAALAARYALPVVGAAVNPLNPDNVFNQGVGGTVTILTGREETLGGWLAELFSSSAREARLMLESPLQVVAGNPVDTQAGF